MIEIVKDISDLNLISYTMTLMFKKSLGVKK